VLTIAASAGAHVAQVEVFALAVVRAGSRESGGRYVQRRGIIVGVHHDGRYVARQRIAARHTGPAAAVRRALVPHEDRLTLVRGSLCRSRARAHPPWRCGRGRGSAERPDRGLTR
jgi:hypothetical protein